MISSPATEFGVLPNRSRGDAVEVIERLRRAVPMEESCSAGLALWDQQELGERLIARADAALYEAKNRGRDRMVIADEVGPAMP